MTESAAPRRAPLLTYTFFRRLARYLVFGLLRPSAQGAENVPPAGGVLLAMNHLGGADPVLVIAFSPRPVAALGKAEVMGWPVLGALARAYGMLPVRRGEPDRATLNAALDVLGAGRALLIAPEGRESHTGRLERAKHGAAFLALKAGVPIVPIAITGTSWPNVLGTWRRLRRPEVTITFGQPFSLAPDLERGAAADAIMHCIAGLLPPDYRGVYAAQP